MRRETTRSADNLWEGTAANTGHKLRLAIKLDLNHLLVMYEQCRQVHQTIIMYLRDDGDPDLPADRGVMKGKTAHSLSIRMTIHV